MLNVRSPSRERSPKMVLDDDPSNVPLSARGAAAPSLRRGRVGRHVGERLLIEPERRHEHVAAPRAPFLTTVAVEASFCVAKRTVHPGRIPSLIQS